MATATTILHPAKNSNVKMRHNGRSGSFKAERHGELHEVGQSLAAREKRAEEHLAAMRLLIPLMMIMILFVLWYAGMPLLPK